MLLRGENKYILIVCLSRILIKLDCLVPLYIVSLMIMYYTLKNAGLF